MYLQTSRLQYNLQGAHFLQTAFSKKQIRLSPYGNCTTKPMILQPARMPRSKQRIDFTEKNGINERCWVEITVKICYNKSK